VTCVARGASGDVPPGARFVRADRAVAGALGALDGTFDAVLDVARQPSQIRSALAELSGRAGHWSFVSTCSVYADNSTPGQQAANASTLPAAPPEMDDPAADPAAYGRCKVAGEQAVLGSGVPALIGRPGLIVGPEDPSDRFTYWVVRLARGGPVLAPGNPDDLVQMIDVRDLAAWHIRSADKGLTGVYDTIGSPIGRAEFLAMVARGVGTDPELIWVDQDFLHDHEVQPWMGPRSLPLFLPLPEYAGFLSRDVSPTLATGLTCRHLADTARDTLEWYNRAGHPNLKTGLDPADEAGVLEAWRTAHR